MELTFTREDIPKITRATGSGREPEKWEEHLAPAKDTPDVSFRVWTYDKRTSAVSRMSAVRDRLTKAVPSENWTLAVRPIPGTEDAVHPEGATDKDGQDIAGTSATQYGVYVAYVGTFTDEEVAENARLHAERSERVKASRAANETAEGEPETTEPVAEPTPQERIAAARQKANA
jgi:hypothetical protein